MNGHAFFALYQQGSEYRFQNSGMDLAGFQRIYWWEYAHRLWGRILGLWALLPLLGFLATSRLPRILARKMAGITILIGLQGVMGWVMVVSGLSVRTDVSPIRLTAHLLLALAIAAWLLRIYLSCCPAAANHGTTSRSYRAWLIGLAWLIVITFCAGGLVAGNDGGLIYNEFPYMGKSWIPEDYRIHDSWFTDMYDNPAAAQLHHRILGTVVITYSWCGGVYWWRAGSDVAPRAEAALICLMTASQFMLGILTVWLVVPMALALSHQLMGFALFLAVQWALYRSRPLMQRTILG